MILANNNIRTNLKLLAGVVAALLIVMTALVYYGMTAEQEDAKFMYDNRLLAIKNLNESRAHARAWEGDLYEASLAPTITAEKLRQRTDDMRQRQGKLAKSMDGYANAVLDDYEKSKLSDYMAAGPIFRDLTDRCIHLLESGQRYQAYLAYHQYEDTINKAHRAATELADYNAEVAAREMEATARKVVILEAAIVVCGLVIVAITLSMLLIISRSIVGQLAALQSSVQTDDRGNVSLREIEVLSRNELGVLSASLNRVVARIRDFIVKTGGAAEQVASSSQELTASAHEAAQASNQTAQAVTQIAEGTNTQLDAVTETSAIVQQISASMQQLAASASYLMTTADKSAESARLGGQAVETVVAQMKSINQTVSHSAAVVTRLGDSSKQISSIINTISQIASQTNLLALNAAIEAARAGEQGRGFAVVAEEVRKLAEQVQDAVKQISGMISEIQSETESAVVSINRGNEEVKRGTEVADQAGGLFAQVYQMVTEMASQVKEASQAINQAATGTQKIVSSVQSVEKNARDAAASAQTVSAATEQQSATMEEIASASQSLAKLAADMQSEVQQFKL
ncbi:MAG: methyl-accepting chemotaxis protein [Negativicutes bacterium]|nr:methyl-accepting chemotaxis protein [Negativicutes bacterium]